jgi:hypothetical protein
MPGTEQFETGYTTGKNAPARPLVQPDESIGVPHEAPATDVADENSAFALLKGMAAALGVPEGSGFADVNDASRVNPDPLATLGSIDDAAATDAAEPNSAISLLKGICAELGL